MNLKNLFKRKEDKSALIEEGEIKAEISPLTVTIPSTIDINVYTDNWHDVEKNLIGTRALNIDSLLFKKLGFKNGDQIQIFSAEVSDEINKKVHQWYQFGKKLPKSFFKIISDQRGEFILGVCSQSVTLIKADLTEKKQYEFRSFSLDNVTLTSEENIICQQNMKLEILYSSNLLAITCRNINENSRSIKFKFNLEYDNIAYFDAVEVTEANINRIKDETSEIRNQLLELKEIPTNENNDGIIKLLSEISLNSFFKEDIVLEEIVLTSKDREDTVKFKDKKVESYIIKDLTQETVRETWDDYGLVNNKDYVIETSAQGTVIKLPKISKDIWLNGINQCLPDIVFNSINEQKEEIDELLTKVDSVLVKRLKLENK